MFKRCVLDIETTMDHKTVRLVGVQCIDTGLSKVALWSPHKSEINISEFLGGVEEVWTWNGARFDFPVLEKVLGYTLDQKKVKHIDLMLMAKMIDPEATSYSLDNYSRAVLLLKEDETKLEIDYDKAPLTELSTYLKRDLELTRKVGIKLHENSIYTKNKEGFDRAMSLETRVAKSVQGQVDKGIDFNLFIAEATLTALNHTISKLEDNINKELPEVPMTASEIKHPPKIQFKKDGSPSSNLLKYLKANDWLAERTIGGQLRAVSSTGDVLHLPLTEPLVTHSKLLIQQESKLKVYFLSQGWKPTMYNNNPAGERTSPRIADRLTKEICPSLLRLKLGWIDDYMTYRSLKNRRNVLASPNGTGWIPQATARGGIIPSDADTLGANTARFTHRVVANVPRPSSLMGKEFRSMFRAREGMVWVGWDADSLEANMEGHYVYPFDPEYVRELIDGDVHTKNMSLNPWLPNRDEAKRFKYGVTYGQQWKGMGKTFGLSDADAKRNFDQFWANAPGLSAAREAAQLEYARMGGWITGLDGRLIKGRSPHSILNARFQSAGAIVMKYAAVLAESRIRDEVGDSAYPLVRYHDEEIYECKPEDAAAVAAIGEWSVKRAGEVLKLNVPLSASAKIGNNWLEVH